MIGVSSVDSSSINLGKRVWSDSLSDPARHVDALRCEIFRLDFVFLFFVFLFLLSMEILDMFTDCAPHQPRGPIKWNAKIENHLPCLIRATHSINSHWAKGPIRCLWYNGYRRRKWTRRHEFKSWMRLIAFHIALILFSLQLWVNSRTDWVLQPWWGS